MAKSDTPVIPPLPSASEFCLKTPLYLKFKLEEGRSPFFGIEFFKGTIDCLCHVCGRHSVFSARENDYVEHYGSFTNYYFSLVFQCSRNDKHQLLFIFRAHEGFIEKIGQYPSLADLATPDLQKYRSLLGEDRYKELTRGVGLAAHGVGIGAFVYLRRIFEFLIEKAATAASKDAGWNQEDFERERMDGKIGILKSHLPQFLVENKSLYGILSRGVHTLSEDECMRAFSIVMLGIELILDDELERHKRSKKIETATKEIANLKRKL